MVIYICPRCGKNLSGQNPMVLHMLIEAGPAGVTTGEFLSVGIPRYSARCEDLRQRGHDIPPAERIREGQWRYVLVSGSASTRSPITPVGAEPDTRASEPASATPLDAFSTDGALQAGADSDTLFDSPPRKKRTTRSAVTGDWMDE